MSSRLLPILRRRILLKIAQTIEDTLKSELFLKTIIGIGTVASHLRELADAL